ncbi:hypothetical protein [Exiguobacterium sp. KRL4]|uniref:hypothetical protein n=1 Tax=Exiguobacterium sp. KRL4 TaxID=1914536 RepID=UPI00191BB79E|nr:hypothetical protein [Exiguobacterium sp. KRL4]
MNNGQPDFNSDFALQYDSFIRLAVPAYEQLFPMSDSFFIKRKKRLQLFWLLEPEEELSYFTLVKSTLAGFLQEWTLPTK